MHRRYAPFVDWDHDKLLFEWVDILCPGSDPFESLLEWDKLSVNTRDKTGKASTRLNEVVVEKGTEDMDVIREAHRSQQVFHREVNDDIIQILAFLQSFRTY